jgi:hypothetical protein
MTLVETLRQHQKYSAPEKNNLTFDSFTLSPVQSSGYQNAMNSYLVMCWLSSIGRAADL